MDVPRLSTVQAHLIILKAREAMPKRGYYYRSWLSIVNCFQMAKDLGLDEHFEDHQEGKPCGSSPADCLTKSRVWQTIFICENMIAGSQGKFTLAPIIKCSIGRKTNFAQVGTIFTLRWRVLTLASAAPWLVSTRMSLRFLVTSLSSLAFCEAYIG